MNYPNNIDVSFSETLRNSDLKGVTIDFAESIMDSMLKEGLVKDLPILGAIFGIGHLTITIKDKLLLKKIMHFLSGINHISITQRQKMIDEINESGSQKVKVGEKLIYILDKCDDHISAKYLSQFFCALINRQISYQDFLKGSRIIQNIFLPDLEYFLDTHRSQFEITRRAEEIPNEDLLPLINAGICGFGYNNTKLGDDGLGEKEIYGGDGIIWITDIGIKLKEVLKTEK